MAHMISFKQMFNKFTIFKCFHSTFVLLGTVDRMNTKQEDESKLMYAICKIYLTKPNEFHHIVPADYGCKDIGAKSDKLTQLHDTVHTCLVSWNPCMEWSSILWSYDTSAITSNAGQYIAWVMVASTSFTAMVNLRSNTQRLLSEFHTLRIPT